jgi:hypothetical protein
LSIIFARHRPVYQPQNQPVLNNNHQPRKQEETMPEITVNVLVLGNSVFKDMVARWLVIERQVGVASFRMVPKEEAEQAVTNSWRNIDAVFMYGDSMDLMRQIRETGFDGHLAAFGGDATSLEQAEAYGAVLHNDSQRGVKHGIKLLIKDLGLAELISTRFAHEDVPAGDTHGVCEPLVGDLIMFLPEDDTSVVCAPIPEEVLEAVAEFARERRTVAI